ncbi:MAG: winged helix-turn-helix transcriptional regulator [Vallitaleaceae bacterium]|nr:winged helix-turn-helix transcriptional regulator [Vallitaleaceae bacterium]
MKKNYVFNFEESLIYDFLSLPDLLFHGETLNETYRELLDPETERFWESIKQKLEPLKSELEKFYNKDFSMIELLYNRFPFTGFTDPLVYLGEINKMEKGVLIEALFYGLVISLENIKEQEAIQEKVKVLVENAADCMTWLNSLPILDAQKWHLFCTIQDPIKMVQALESVMSQVYPIYLEFFKDVKEAVKVYGFQLEKELNEGGEGYLTQITNGIFSEELFTKDTVQLFVSAVFVERLMINESNEVAMIVWGFKMKETFQKIKVFNENKLTERITFFKNLGDRTRYEVLRLVASGVTSTKEIAGALGVSSATISYHLSNLTLANILKIGKTNDTAAYYLNKDFMLQVLEDFKGDIFK